MHEHVPWPCVEGKALWNWLSSILGWFWGLQLRKPDLLTYVARPVFKVINETLVSYRKTFKCCLIFGDEGYIDDFICGNGFTDMHVSNLIKNVYFNDLLQNLTRYTNHFRVLDT